MTGPAVFDRTYFHGRASNYLLGYDRLAPRLWWRGRLRLVRQLVPPGSRLVDLGCAFGYFLKWVEEEYEAYGVDISDYAIMRARRVVRAADRVRCADVERAIPWPAPVDLITAFDLLEHLHDPASALAHCARTLRPSGYLLLEFPTGAPWLDRDATHHYQPLSDWMTLLRGAGFEVEQVRRFWTIGWRAVLVPSRRWTNYVRIVARRAAS